MIALQLTASGVRGPPGPVALSSAAAPAYIQTSRRTCSTPLYGGFECLGPDTKTQDCDNGPCIPGGEREYTPLHAYSRGQILRSMLECEHASIWQRGGWSNVDLFHENAFDHPVLCHEFRHVRFLGHPIHGLYFGYHAY